MGNKYSDFFVTFVRAGFIAVALLALCMPTIAVAQDDDATAEASDTPKPKGRTLVAIDKFENKTDADDALFDSLRARITNEIVNTRKFDVVEREQMQSALSEQRLQQQGLASSDVEANPDAPAEGKMKSAGYVVYGTVLHLGLDGASGTVGDVTASRVNAKVEIQLRITNAENGKILASKEVVAKETQSGIGSSGTSSAGNFADQLIEGAVRKAAGDVVNELMSLAYPIKVVAVGAGTITINLAQEQSEIGKRFKVYSEGEELVDPDTGESLGKDETYMGEVIISEVKPKVSVATPKSPLKTEQIQKGMILRPVSVAEKAQEAAKEKTRRTEEFESRF